MSEAKEHPCPDCQEMVRVNSLRCWNCGAFMNPELEEKYLEMQSKPQETIYSDLPEAEVSSLEDSATSTDGNPDDDFELSMPAATGSESSSDDTGGIPSDPNNPDAPPPKSKAVVKEEEGVTGDALLDIALKDEKHLLKQRRKRAQRGGMTTPGGGLIIFCPYGCRIVVKESHRGMQGKCPECRAPFVVPIDPPDFRKTKAADSPEDAAAAGGFSQWITDLHLHTVNPEKLKLKADSLLKDFVAADFGFSDDQILGAVFGKKSGGRFGGSGAGEDSPREVLKKQLQAGTKIDALDLAEKFAFDKESVSQLKVVQPAASRTDSIFHGIPVFGEGRIAVQLPSADDQADVRYVSMGITQFWEFKKIVEEKFGLTDLGAGIPTEQTYSNHRCHYLETQIKALDNLEFFKADETVELEPVGYQCGKCQAAVSEEGRKRESLGGKSPKGIAKAKCPKCGNKMGDNFLYAIKVAEGSATSDA